MSKVLIAVLNNRNSLPFYFVKSLFELDDFTEKAGIDFDLLFFNAVTVNIMRNQACAFAIKNGYTHIFQMDTDMTYPKDTIVKLLKHNKDFVAGNLRRRHPPFDYINCKTFKEPLSETFKEENTVKPEGKELIEAEMVGSWALIKIDFLKKMKYPYYGIKYEEKEIIGGDIGICQQAKKAGLKLYVDPTIVYGHEIGCIIKENMEIL